MRLLERHLSRLAATADYLGYTINLAGIRSDVNAAATGLAARLQLLVSPDGAAKIERSPLPSTPENALVALVPLPVDPGDWRLRHKTTDRVVLRRGARR